MREATKRRAGVFHRATAAAVTAAWVCAAGAAAEDARGWHVVRPGDTLESITARYLGTPREWRRNWGLNPQVRDPDFLLPGERLRVLLRPEASQPAAQLRNVRRQVDEMPAPIEWKPAADEDLLLMHDGVRTSRTSSAELAFTDGTRLRVDEDSLVFLRGERRRGGEREEIEVVRGQTDVEVVRGPRTAEHVELVLGSARARARAGEGSSGRMRARRPERGAQVMVYSGSGDVAAAGSRVELAAGTGSAVPDDGPPSPAEALLQAPRLEHPAGGVALAVANPRFRWSPVHGARSYVLEFCADSACDDVLRRAAAHEAEWVTQDLPPRSYFWRVTAQSATGLDGFASDVAAFSLSGGGADSAAPTATVGLEGPVISRAGVRYVPAQVPLEIATADDGAVDRWEAVVNDQVIAEAELEKPWKGGAYRTFVRVWDRAGNRAVSPPVAFTVDDTPPAIEWQVAMPSVLRDHGAPLPLVGKALRDASRAARRGGAALSLTADGGNWTPVEPDASGELWHALSQDPQVFVLAIEGAPFAAGAPQLEAGQLVRIHAADAGAGVERLAVSVERTAGGAGALKVTARDRVGNESSAVWPLRQP